MIEDFFKDLKVVELASVLAGPAIGMFFAELGAKVIKIENKTTGGDVTRRWKLPSENKDKEDSAYYNSVNWNKEIHFLNLKETADRQKAYAFLADADLVICNYRPGSASKVGMDYETLNKLNPRLIYAQLNAFDEESTRPAFDIVLQAEAGFMYMCGEPERDPVRMPVALIDLLAAHQLKEAILLALLRRKETGKGSYVSTSLFASAISSLANQATNWLMAGHIPQRMGSLHPNIAPYGEVFYTKDQKPLTLAIGTEKQFKLLCKCLELEELAEGELFKTNVLRVKNRVKLYRSLQSLIANYSRKELQDKLNQMGVPAGSILNMEEVFENPAASRLILSEEKEDGTLTKRVKTVAFEMKE